MRDADWAADFVRYACEKLAQNLAQLARCVRLLALEETWQRPNEHSNSVGNLILHLTGNVRQWILAGIGGETFERDRPAEFAERGPLPTEELLPPLESTVGRAVETIRRLNAPGLTVGRTIQGYDVSTLAAVFHVVEHFSFHTGQIVYATRALRGLDLSLYDKQGHKLTGERMTP